MKKMTSNEIRNTWIRFFKNKGHNVEESALLIPNNDPTLLWINSGVAALKKYFDGSVIPENRRICNIQKAIRTNDIENVGHTARHHTFFEMMGNFSIGDYFRNEAIEFAYELLFSDEYYGLDKAKLYITYHPSDKDTFSKWVSLGINPSHLVPCEENFWEIGEGPCGYDTEMFFDRGEKYDPYHIGLDLLKNDISNDRYIEIWNIVLSQYNAEKDKTRDEYKELPHKNIDTGAGLERFACIMQSAETNYETDLFMPIIQECEKLATKKYEGEDKVSFKIIADHLRTCTFALADGASFSNEGRGYVLRRLLRRSLRHGNKLGIKGGFLTNLVDVVVDIMKEFYPYLLSKKDYIKQLIAKEEQKFLQTLEEGQRKLYELFEKNKNITGEDAFVLYDTYGFPFELTLEIADELNIKINKDEFDKAMKEQKEMARKSRNVANSMQGQNSQFMDFQMKSEFIGYDTLSIKSKIIKVFEFDSQIALVTEKTPFYAEMGGEVADCGIISNVDFIGEVINVTKMPNGQHLHYINLIHGKPLDNMEVTLEVDKANRKKIEANHSATHLLHKALKIVLGEHVYQHGSQVSADKIRFDFNHFENISNEQLLKVETIVKEEIKKNYPVKTFYTSLAKAKEMKVTALFNEKYGNEVRVVDMSFSQELCGGCHVKTLQAIKDFAIISIESKGSGIFRMEAVTGPNLIKKIKDEITSLVEEEKLLVEKLAALRSEVKNIPLDLKIEKRDYQQVNSYQLIINLKIYLEEIKNDIKLLDKKITEEKEKKALNEIQADENIQLINEIPVIIKQLNYDNIELIKKLADTLLDKYVTPLIVLINIYQDKVLFVTKAPKDLVQKGVNCGKIVREMAIICNGNGGGRPDMAQAGGKDVNKVSEVISKIGEIIK